MRVRAKQPVRNTAGADISDHRDQRYIYGGDRGRRVPAYDLPRNRPGTRKRASTFYILLTLFIVAIVSVLYINNIIVVNQLALDVNQLQTRYAKLVNTNAELQAEVNQKSALDIVGPRAIEQLGMEHATGHSESFAIDRSLQVKAAEIDARWEKRSR